MLAINLSYHRKVDIAV